MTSSPPGAATTVAGHHPSSQQPSPSKYFTHAVGTSALRDRFNEVVVQIDFEDPKIVIGTSATVNATPHLTRLLMLIKKHNGTVGEILPLRARSLSPAISLTSDVPTGDDLLPYMFKMFDCCITYYVVHTYVRY